MTVRYSMIDTELEGYIPRLLENEHFTGFTIECCSYDFPVHKCCLYAKSGYFRKLLLSSTKEISEARVVLNDIKPSLVVRLIIFFYSFNNYPKVLKADLLPTSCRVVALDDLYAEADVDTFIAASLAIEMYALGDRFDTSWLTLMVITNFRDAFKTIGKDGTAPRSMRDGENFLLLVDRIYATTPASDSGLRELVLNTILWRINRRDHFLPEYKFIDQLVDSVPDLSHAIAKHYMANPPSRLINDIRLTITIDNGMAVKSKEWWISPGASMRSIFS